MLTYTSKIQISSEFGGRRGCDPIVESGIKHHKTKPII